MGMPSQSDTSIVYTCVGEGRGVESERQKGQAAAAELNTSQNNLMMPLNTDFLISVMSKATGRLGI